MRVLISAASRHGATEEIAQHIAGTLSHRGFEVSVVSPGDVGDIAGFDAVILGSGIYAGHWLPEAKELARRLSDHRGHDIWLFSSGGLGDPPMPGADPVEVFDLMVVMAARGHRNFAGRLDRSLLNLAERAIVKMVKAPDGDFRPWDEIASWAEEIAAALEKIPAPSS